MKVLWLCNIMLPVIAGQLGMEASNKEGWLSGLAAAVRERRTENEIELAVAFPAPAGMQQGETCGDLVKKGETPFLWYAFSEDTVNPHLYDASLEQQMQVIWKDFQPDVVHCFGTEYPHTLAMCRSFPYKNRLLIGIQGLCSVCAEVYLEGLPSKVIRSVTVRDLLRKDSILEQQRKFALRGSFEREAVEIAGNVTGRTDWDRNYATSWNPQIRYYKMNETLRSDFYEGQWSPENCEKHSIFVSQADYPIKGFHYMLKALPLILKKFPDAKVYVAGNSIVGEENFLKKLKISGYGKYLRSLMNRYQLWERVVFLGRLSAAQMKQQYLKSHVFVCCSTIENSPNSLGEAMLLGVPCVSARVGGIPSIFDGNNALEDRRDGWFYQQEETGAALANSITSVFENEEKSVRYAENARNHALQTHDSERNYGKMVEIYRAIAGEPAQGAEVPEVVFVSNYINHHQIPFCNAMQERLGEGFYFIQTQPIEEERLRMGWRDEEKRSYVKYFYEEPQLCKRLIDQSRVVIFGGTDDESYIRKRLRDGKPVLRYTERLYKEGQWRAVSPRGLIQKYKDHTRYRKSPVYVLCAGAYVPSDFHLIHAYPGKLLKWGYFPETREYDVEELLTHKKPASLLWAARFLDWKHPETAVLCAAYLKGKGIPFHLNMVGDGQMRPMVEQLIARHHLEEEVTLLGYRTPEQVRQLMEESVVYLTTSDRREGWGAVINEAMNSGCGVVASHMMGAAPWLIRQGENGLLYRDGRQEEFNQCVERLLADPEYCKQLGRAAYFTIRDQWNARNAADRLIAFCQKKPRPAEGPCSTAEVVSERKMLCRLQQKN